MRGIRGIDRNFPPLHYRNGQRRIRRLSASSFGIRHYPRRWLCLRTLYGYTVMATVKIHGNIALRRYIIQSRILLCSRIYKITALLLLAEEFSSASRSVKPGLVCSGIVSAWTWSATLMVSSLVVFQFGISGGWWYGVSGT